MRGVAKFIAVASILLVGRLDAQTSVPPWNRDSLQSAVLGETRRLRIALPSGYNLPENKEERYPVLVVLDAQWDLSFSATVANAQFLAVSAAPAIPRLIIVGVETGGPDRFHDLMPPANTESSGEPVSANGGAAFLKFLSTELLPYVAKNFRSQPFTVLAGHSMSGLFTAWALSQGGLADAGIAISPSLQEDSAVTRQIRDGLLRRSPLLFMMSSTDETIQLDSAVASLASELSKSPSVAGQIHYVRGSYGTHSQTPLVGMIEGLQVIFKPVSLGGQRLPRLYNRITNDSMVTEFESMATRYLAGARRLGLEEKMPYGFLLAQTVAFGDSASSKILLRICQEMIRTSTTRWEGFGCAADAYMRAGSGNLALPLYVQAEAAASRAGNSEAVRQFRRKIDGLRSR